MGSRCHLARVHPSAFHPNLRPLGICSIASFAAGAPACASETSSSGGRRMEDSSARRGGCMRRQALSEHRPGMRSTRQRGPLVPSEREKKAGPTSGVLRRPHAPGAAVESVGVSRESARPHCTRRKVTGRRGCGGERAARGQTQRFPGSGGSLLPAHSHTLWHGRETAEHTHSANRTRQPNSRPRPSNPRPSTPTRLGTRADGVVRHQAQLGSGEHCSDTPTGTFYAVHDGPRRPRRMLTAPPRVSPACR